MDRKKMILVGCDDPVNLNQVLHGLFETDYFLPEIITANTVNSLAGIAKSEQPDLVILCFRNSQKALDEFNSVFKRIETPVICLTDSKEANTMSWSSGNIIFIYPLEQVSVGNRFILQINSIFLLRPDVEPLKQERQLVQMSQQQNQSRNNRELSCKVLELDQKVEVLSKIKDQIIDLFPRVNDNIRSELTYIVNGIRKSVNDNNLWDDFKNYFVKTNPNFLLMLAKKYPALTQIDIKYCCYLRMNMSNDEIRALLGINQESVRTHKYRLKKKMELNKDQSLRTFLQAVG